MRLTFDIFLLKCRLFLYQIMNAEQYRLLMSSSPQDQNALISQMRLDKNFPGRLVEDIGDPNRFSWASETVEKRMINPRGDISRALQGAQSDRLETRRVDDDIIAEANAEFMAWRLRNFGSPHAYVDGDFRAVSSDVRDQIEVM